MHQKLANQVPMVTSMNLNHLILTHVDGARTTILMEKNSGNGYALSIIKMSGIPPSRPYVSGVLGPVWTLENKMERKLKGKK